LKTIMSAWWGIIGSRMLPGAMVKAVSLPDGQ